MGKRLLIGGVLAASLVFVVAAIAANVFKSVKPAVFDPAHSNLAQSGWLSGIGCPTSQDIQAFLPPNFDTTGTVTYADAGCPTTDPGDKTNEGLLLAKTGPTNDNAAGTAQLKDVKGITLTELGYDIRKGGAPGSATGSHCGAGAPRFNVTTSDGSWFIGCNSPPPTVTSTSDGWTRLRWSPVTGFKDGVTQSPVTGKVKDISIVFDEGQDTGPDFFGLAVLDNVDVNGTLVGQGAGPQNDENNDENDDNDNNDNHGGDQHGGDKHK